MPESKALRQQILWILGPGAAYVGLFLARPLWYRTPCAADPLPCSPLALNALDRTIPLPGTSQPDFYSNCIQNGVGIFAFLLPWVVFRKVRPARSLNLILLALIATNGALMEAVRALIQRPRPLVLLAPLTEGSNIHHYTSFYSGHTSFVALALLFTLLWVRSGSVRRRPEQTRWLTPVFGFLYLALTATTGALRVLGGRHYPTDTIAGWLFGSLLAWFLGRKMLRQLDEELPSSRSI